MGNACIVCGLAESSAMQSNDTPDRNLNCTIGELLVHFVHGTCDVPTP